MGTRLPSLKHILALHTSATSTAGVSAGVSAFTYRHKHGTVNNLWIICHFQPTNFTCIPSICTAKYTLKARWFVFALESLEDPEDQNMTTFTIVVLSNHVWKGSQMLPAHVALPMHLPGIFYTGVKVRIPLAICNQKYDNCNLAAEVRTLGRIVYFFQLLVLLQAPKPIDRSITQTQERFMHASSSMLTCRLPKNMKQPLELQLGLLGPANFAHPRSQSNRMGTLAKTYFGPTHFSHLDGRSFSRRRSFHLSSQTRYRE